MKRFANLELTTFERAELPGVEFLRAWDAFEAFGDLPGDVYPDIRLETLSLIGRHAVTLNDKNLDYAFLFGWIRELWDLLLKQGEFVAPLPDESLLPVVQALRHACLALGDLSPKHQKDWFRLSDLWALFIDTWKAVKHPVEHNVFDLAVCRAQRYPVTLNREAFGIFWSEEREAVASIAFHLQGALPDHDICMPTEAVGVLYGRVGEGARQYGARLINPLRDKKLLKLTQPWIPNKAANQYRFMSNRLDLYTPPSKDDVTYE